MKIKYFSDTDTALVEFSDRTVAETKEINENIYIDVDRSGNLVAMTIEHARQQASLPFLSYEQIEKESPNDVNKILKVSDSFEKYGSHKNKSGKRAAK